MLRLILVIIILILLVRIFINMGREVPNRKEATEKGKDNRIKKKGVPRELGEYVEFEEVEKKEGSISSASAAWQENSQTQNH